MRIFTLTLVSVWLVACPCSYHLGLTVSTQPNLKIPQTIDEPSKKDRFYEMASIPVVRQRRASSVDIPTIDQNGIIPSQVNARRKSLPALGLPSKVSFLFTTAYHEMSIDSMDLI